MANAGDQQRRLKAKLELLIGAADTYGEGIGTGDGLDQERLAELASAALEYHRVKAEKPKRSDDGRFGR